MNYHLSTKGNTKTGRMLVTTSSKDTCPDSCPLKEKGCYAKYSFLGKHWNEVTLGNRGGSFEEMLQAIEKQVDGSLWRMNQAGDLPHNRDIVDAVALSAITKANRGKRGFTYTHHDPELNRNTLESANSEGFTINLSANSVEQADAYKSLYSLPVAAVVPDGTKNGITPGGHKLVICPAQTVEGMTCLNCGICAKPDRKAIVGFLPHGTGKKSVNLIAKGA